MKDIDCNIKKYDSFNKLKAYFFYYPPLIKAGQKIRFHDVSSGNPDNRYWNFGDGHVSTEKNPIHAYNSPNIYYVSLQVMKGDSISIENRYILVRTTSNTDSQKPKADFIIDPENPEAGVPVRFYDKSTGNPDKRIWQFGYFDFSFLKDPIKIFPMNKKYAITLTVKNRYGEDKCTKYIEVGKPLSNVIIARSCAQSDVRTAIAQANPGDTVIVPNGSATWDDHLVITKGIILKAQTKGGVSITSNYSAISKDIFDPANYLISYIPSHPENDEPFRLSGFSFNLNNKVSWLLLKNYPDTHVLTKIRIDNNSVINYISSINVMFVCGAIYGVMDNNYISGPSHNSLIRFHNLNIYAWNNFTFDFGTGSNFYIEDNEFVAPDTLFFYGEAGGRYCVRYNVINASSSTSGLYPFADIHGNDPNSWTATMGTEIYENTINVGAKGCDLLDIRGGKSLCYNNYVTGQNGAFVQIREEYLDSQGPGPAKSPISGQPQHVSDTYFWGNKINSQPLLTKNLQILDYGEPEGIVPREDVHFWMEKTNFNGSSGIGIGPLSARPAICTTEGVAWWATDEQKLYRWKNGKWEFYYSPYTYPHPLRTILGDN